MKVADDGKSVTWAVRKEVRRKECIGCVPVLSNPKPDGESVGTTEARRGRDPCCVMRCETRDLACGQVSAIELSKVACIGSGVA